MTDAHTGELLWKFHTAQAPGGGDSWAGAPVEGRMASTWGLPGSYDPDTGLIYWGIANPMPNTRAARHGSDANAIPFTAPADLFSDSTVAIDPDTGKLVWYYQHLPGDDWDEDINEERIILHTRVAPDPSVVRWINPAIEPGEERDIIVNVGEGGGIWALDKTDGEFLWATPFPFDVDNFILKDIAVRTGITHINDDLIVDEPGERHVVCFFNTRSYWPSAYNPEQNALYVPYIDNCLDMTSAAPKTADHAATRERRNGIARPGANPDEMNGLARIDMATGRISYWAKSRVPSTGAVLATAGGKQYVAVITGDNLAVPGLISGTMGPAPVDIDPGRGNNAIYVFALPDSP